MDFRQHAVLNPGKAALLSRGPMYKIYICGAPRLKKCFVRSRGGGVLFCLVSLTEVRPYFGNFQ